MVTADPAIRDAVESAAAALGRRVDVVGDVSAALGAWARASVVLVGGDTAAALAAAGPPRRPRVHLLGFDAGALGTWSLPLGAEVVPLPQGLPWLVDALWGDEGPASWRIAVAGGCGGIGASTLAVGLAQAAAAGGASVALVDLDPLGGGLDLLLGAERTPGWRWPRLLGARGEVGDVRGVLPDASGITLVAMSRDAPVTEITPEPLHAVLGALRRHHEVIVLDAGRHPAPPVHTVVRGADARVLLSGGGVRAVAAAAGVRESLGWSDAGVVTRTSLGGTPGILIAESLGLPWWGDLPAERRLSVDADAGEPPWRPGTRWGRAVRTILARARSEARDDD